MKTPITDSTLDKWADEGTARETIIPAMRGLELDRAALMETLDTLTLVVGLTPIKGNLEALQEAQDLARATLAAARANFPTP